MEETLSNRGDIWASDGWARLYDGLLAGLAHDLSGRVSALRSLALVGRRGAPSDDFVLDELDAESMKLEGIVNTFLALPSPGSGLGPRAGWTDCEPLVRGVVSLLERHHGLSGADLACTTSPGSPSIRVPRNRLTPVLLALAADVAARTGQARLTAAPLDGDGGVVLEVHGGNRSGNGSGVDDGLGLSESEAQMWAAEVADLSGSLERSGEVGWRLVIPTESEEDG